MEYNGGGYQRLLRYHGGLPDGRDRTRLRNNRSKGGMTDGLDLINRLPNECIIQIFGFLPSQRDRCSCAAVSKKWLLMQASMESADFTTKIPTAPTQNDRTTKVFMGDRANDLRIAAMAVGMGCRGAVTDVTLSGIHSSVAKVTDLGFKILAKACPRLKSLTLMDSPGVSGKGLAFVAHGCNGLERLEITNSPLLEDEGLIAIAKACPNLMHLNLESLPLIGNNSLYAFAVYSPYLQSLSLASCRLFTDEGVASILSRSPELVKVELASLRVQDGILKAIGKHGKSIRELSLKNLSRISQMGFHYIGGMARVEFLSLKSCSGLNDAIFEGIGYGFSSLKRIEITSCNTLTDDGLFELIDSAILLEDFRVEKCNNVTAYGLVGVFLKRSERLKTLSLVECEIKERENHPNFTTNLLPKTNFLKSLTIDNCEGFCDGFLGWLGKIRLLVKHLALMRLDKVTDVGIISFLHGVVFQRKGLNSVDLSGCQNISDLSVLIITWAFGWKLRVLTLGNCLRLTDASMVLISRFCYCLLELDLSRCLITDYSLNFIQSLCGNLDALSLQECPNLSNDTLDVIRDALWWCDLET